MNISKTILVFTLTLTLLSNVVAQPKDFSSFGETLNQYLKIIHLKKGFSGEVLVAKGSTVLYQETFGLASIEHSLELKKGAKFQIASITKTFTASLIALAEEEKKLNTEDKAIDYIKGLSQKFEEITISQLLTHTSGLPHNEGIQGYWHTKSKLHLNTEQIVAEINDVELLFQPGSQKHYSSLGYYLLAAILETVYEDDFHHILQEKILQKLQMEGTGTANTMNIIPRMASGYHFVKDDSLVKAPYRNYSMLKGAGDMYSTALDLLKWNNTFFSNERNNYGWFQDNEHPRKYYHGGGTWGYSSFNAIYPDDEISIIILSNISTLPVKEIALDIEKIVFGKPFNMPEISNEIPIDTIDLEKYSGIYTSDSGQMKLHIINSDNGLFAKLATNPPFQIYPKGNHSFFGKKVEIDLIFELQNDVISGLKAERMGQVFHFNKDAE